MKVEVVPVERDVTIDDNIYTTKDTYKNRSIQLVAKAEGQIVGLQDMEYERDSNTVAYD